MVETESQPGKRIRKHEIALTTWKTIAFLRQTESASTIECVEIPQDWPEPFQELQSATTLSNPKEATSWRTITKPNEIEYYLLLRNRLHFGQAQGTPFTVDPFQREIPWGANSSQSEAILQGVYIPGDQVPTLCKEVIYACQNREESPLISPNLSYEAF